MNLQMWLAFSIASVVLLIIPGPTILTVISYSVSHGYKVKIPLILAVSLGDSTALALSLLGLGAVLAESAFWFEMVKWVGGLYLLYLGIKLLRAGIKSSETSQDNKSMSSRRLFINTYFITALNPKGIIFFVAFLPQFIDPGRDVTSQFWLLAITFVALATLNATMYVLFAGKASQVLSTPKTQRIFNATGGSLLSVAGLWALSAKQV